MARTHLLDTSVYSQPLNPRPLPSVQQRWNTLGEEVLAISAVTEAEVLFGLELKQSKTLNQLYNDLLKNKFPIIPVDDGVAENFSKLKSAARKRGHSCSDFDFLIAATAKTHRLILATLDFRHFSGMEGILVENWS